MENVTLEQVDLNGINEEKTRHKTLRIFVGSWNVGNAPPPKDPEILRHWLPYGGEDYDVIAIGLQESNYSTGKSPKLRTNATEIQNEEPKIMIKRAFSAEEDVPSPTNEKAKLHYEFFTELQQFFGNNYTIAMTKSLLEVRLIVFIHNTCQFSDIESIAEATGIGNVVGNKGGVVVKLKVEDTSLCFVNCHLAAHEGEKHLKRRNDDCAEILNGCKLGIKSIQLDQQFDHIFWFGDMNYRLNWSDQNEETKESNHSWDAVYKAITEEDWKTLNEKDELAKQVKTNQVLTGFSLPPANFAPTFKRKRNELREYHKQRIPAYCDRILWKSLPSFSENLKLLSFNNAEKIGTSDHKPVFATFEVKTTTIPIATQAESSKCIRVVITDLRAEKLLEMDVGGLSDPYVRFYMLPQQMLPYHEREKSNQEKGLTTTSVILKNLNPKWTDEDVPKLRLHTEKFSDLENCHLVLCCMDWDATSQDDFLGAAILPLKEYISPDSTEFNKELVRNGKVSGKITGKIQLFGANDARRRRSSIIEVMKTNNCGCVIG